MPEDKQAEQTPSVKVVGGLPETAEEMINKYGTYEIQPTADSDHIFPAIAQGLPTGYAETMDKPRIKRIRKGKDNDKTF